MYVNYTGVNTHITLIFRLVCKIPKSDY